MDSYFKFQFSNFNFIKRILRVLGFKSLSSFLFLRSLPPHFFLKKTVCLQIYLQNVCVYTHNLSLSLSLHKSHFALLPRFFFTNFFPLVLRPTLQGIHREKERNFLLLSPISIDDRGQ